jgi:hypothetical protein
MNMILDTVSTSDADERELLEAANSTLYWQRVIASSRTASSDPQVGDMEDIMADSDSLVRASDGNYVITGKSVRLRCIEGLSLPPLETLLLSYLLARMARRPPQRRMDLSPEQYRKFLQHPAGPVADPLPRLLLHHSLLLPLLPRRCFTSPKR